MHDKIARFISMLFHPVLLPTLGILLLMNSGFYFSMLTPEVKRFILLVTLFSTCVLPLLAVAVMALNPRFDVSMPKSKDRVLPLLASSIFYYLGFLLLSKVRAVPELRIFVLASVLVIIALLVVSLKWKISNHMAAIGGLSGTLFALSFRSGMNPVYSILIVVLVAGVIGSARLRLGKHDIWQIMAGYMLGFLMLYCAIYFS